MAEHLTDAVNGDTIGIQETCKSLTNLMTALYLHPLTLGIFFQNIGNLSGNNALAVPRKDVFAFTWDFMQDFQRFGDKYYKPVLIGLCVLHNFVAVCSLVAHFLTDDMEAVSLNVGPA